MGLREASIGQHLLASLYKQGFSADPFYGRATSSPMLGSLKTDLIKLPTQEAEAPGKVGLREASIVSKWSSRDGSFFGKSMAMFGGHSYSEVRIFGSLRVFLGAVPSCESLALMQ